MVYVNGMVSEAVSSRVFWGLILILALALPLGAQSVEKTVLPSAPGIHVTGRPGSRVYINGEYRGNVPCYIMLGDGVTEIKIRLRYDEVVWEVRRDDTIKEVTSIGEDVPATAPLLLAEGPPAAPEPASEPVSETSSEPAFQPEEPKADDMADLDNQSDLDVQEAQEEQPVVSEPVPEPSLAATGPGTLEIRDFIQGSLLMIDGERTAYDGLTPLELPTGEKEVYLWKKGRDPMKEAVSIRSGENTILTQSRRLSHGRKSFLWFLAGASLGGSAWALNEYADPDYAVYAGIGAAVCLLPLFTELFLHGYDETEYRRLKSESGANSISH